MVAKKPRRRRIRAMAIGVTEAERIVASLYRMGNDLVSRTPRERFLILNALCATFLVNGRDVSAESTSSGKSE